MGYPASYHLEHCDYYRPNCDCLLTAGARGNELALELQGAAMEALISCWTILNWCSLYSQAVKVSCLRSSCHWLPTL